MVIKALLGKQHSLKSTKPKLCVHCIGLLQLYRLLNPPFTLARYGQAKGPCTNPFNATHHHIVARVVELNSRVAAKVSEIIMKNKMTQ